MKNEWIERWENVAASPGNSFNHHWHHDSSDPGDFISIRMSDESVEPLGGYGNGWTVEIYPDPDKPMDAMDEMTRFHYSPEEHPRPMLPALMKVFELMERHS